MTPLILCVCFQEKPAPLLAFAEFAFGLTPQLAIRPNEALFLELTQSQKLLHSQEELLRAFNALAASLRCTPHFAFADSPGKALVYARFGQTDTRRLPLEALYDWASPFAIDESLQEVIAPVIVTLKKLGLKNLEDFLKLPSQTLPSRFNKSITLLQTKIRHFETSPWPRFFLPLKVSEEIAVFDEENLSACEHLETLLFSLKTASDRLFFRLSGRGESLSRFELRLFLENRSERQWLLKLPIAQSSTAGLLPILQDRLNHDLQFQPLATGVMKLRLTALETQRAQSAQKNLFHRREEGTETWEQVFARLAAHLGVDKVFIAAMQERYAPDKAWVKVNALNLNIPFVNPDKIPSRPSRLLPIPLRLQASENILQLATNQKQLWHASRWEGPERICGEWWERDVDPASPDLSRDYYKVFTDEGVELWVFEDLNNEALYLHGYFD